MGRNEKGGKKEGRKGGTSVKKNPGYGLAAGRY